MSPRDTAFAESTTPTSTSSASKPPTLLFAMAAGVIALNLFAPQTLVGVVAPSIDLDPRLGGLVAMAPLVGYAAGLLLLVPMADLVENRALVLRMLILAILASVMATIAPNAAMLLPVLTVLGAMCAAIQILVPMAAAMAAPESRGRVIGDVMGGVLAGIVLARPVASVITEAWSWRAFYATSAVAMALIALIVTPRLPRLHPQVRTGYVALLASLWHILRSEVVLRRRAMTAGLVMAAFSLFWTCIALRLSLAPFELGQRGIALFALVSAGGALASPAFGRVGDRGWTRSATTLSHAMLLGSLALAAWAETAALDTRLALVLMALGALLLDIAITGDQTLGRRAVNLLRPEARGRINGLFVGLFFIGGAIGSAIAGFVWAYGGWNAACAVAALFGIAALIIGRLEKGV